MERIELPTSPPKRGALTTELHQIMEDPENFEISPFRLKGGCSASELRVHLVGIQGSAPWSHAYQACALLLSYIPLYGQGRR